MSAEIIFGTDFHARRDREAAEFLALSKVIAGDRVFVDEKPKRITRQELILRCLADLCVIAPDKDSA